MGDFDRTLQTATEAQATAALLRRAATDARSVSDKIKLGALADRYLEYAQALRETISVPEEGRAENQPALL